MKTYTTMKSSIGELFIVTDSAHIISIHMGEQDFAPFEKQYSPTFDPNLAIHRESIKQLEEYFRGVRKDFQLPITLEGTTFQKKVWDELNVIPYGETRSYQDIAKAIGNIKAVRAIGQANKANRLPIIIPCHRVIGKNQSLTGYAGSRINIKSELLQLEGVSFKK